MKIRSRAPLRLGIAGGGTDVSPYSDIHGGAVLNATLNLYAKTYIEKSSDNNSTTFIANDIEIKETINTNKPVCIAGNLMLHRAVYKKVMERFNDGNLIPLIVTTECDAPPGSGLGSSSAIVVSMLEAYRNLLALPLGEYDLAHLAYEIERKDCGFSGGKQDQYAATFGGFNFIEFAKNDRVIVNPLRIKNKTIYELESSIILFYTGASRESAKIIDNQINAIKKGGTSLEAMHHLKESAYRIKEFILKDNIEKFAEELKITWLAKKATSSSISNYVIDGIENSVMNMGALSVKVSGAGGGGFIMVITKPENKSAITKELKKLGGTTVNFNFIKEGAFSWRI